MVCIVGWTFMKQHVSIGILVKALLKRFNLSLECTGGLFAV